MSWHRRPKDDDWKEVTPAQVHSLGLGLWIMCDGCFKDTIEPDPLAFADRLGLPHDTPLLLIGEAMRCIRCGEKKVIVRPETRPNSRR